MKRISLAVLASILFLSLGVSVYAADIQTGTPHGFTKNGNGGSQTLTYDEANYIVGNNADGYGQSGYNDGTTFKGRSWTITVDDGGSGKSTYNCGHADCGIKGITTVTGHSDLTGNLTFLKWKITNSDLDKDGDYLSYQAITNIAAQNGRTLTATAQWDSKTLNFWKDVTPTLNGYTFSRWSSNVGSGVTGVSVGGSSTSTTSFTISPATNAANLGLTAVWTANTYTVTFDYNKPSIATADVKNNTTTTKSVTFDSTYGVLPEPTLEGWTFKGWTIKVTGSSHNADGASITKDSKVVTWVNHTLVANWEETEYTLTTDSNSKGTVTGTAWTRTYKFDHEYQIPANPYAKNYTVSFNTSGGDAVGSKTMNWSFRGWTFNTPSFGTTVLPSGVKDTAYNYTELADTVLGYKVVGTLDPWVMQAGYLTEKNQPPKTIADQATVKNLSKDKETITLYATWKPNPITLPTATKANNSFLGWYRIPQDETGSGYSLSQVYVGYTGDNFNTDTNITLYAWWNKQPVYVDIYSGLFFEGQTVSYANLMKLIGDYDEDDLTRDMSEELLRDVTETEVNELIEATYQDMVKRIDNDMKDAEERLNRLLEIGVDIYDPRKMEIEDEIVGLTEEKEELERARVQAISDAAMRKVTTSIAKIEYFGTEEPWGIREDGTIAEPIKVDSYYTSEASENSYRMIIDYETGNVTDALVDNEEIIYLAQTPVDYDAKYLDTGTDKIGRVRITYQATDEGIMFAGEKIPYSSNTVEYTRTIQINFNFNPLLSSQSVLLYKTKDFGSSLADYMIERQAIKDSEDLQDNIPWWSSLELTDTEMDELLFADANNDTKETLYSTIMITGIDSITFVPQFEHDYPEVVSALYADYVSPEVTKGEGSDVYDNWGDKRNLVDTLGNFKDNNELYHGVAKSVIWDNITSMQITFDAHDQWGKYASGRVTSDATAKHVVAKYKDPVSGLFVGNAPSGYIKEFTSGNAVDEEIGGVYPNSVIQSDLERSVSLVLINPSSDMDALKSANIREEIQFISAEYLSELSPNSFWGDPILGGRQLLEDVLSKRENLGSLIGETHEGSFDTNSGHEVEININDYTNSN